MPDAKRGANGLVWTVLMVLAVLAIGGIWTVFMLLERAEALLGEHADIGRNPAARAAPERAMSREPPAR